VTTTTDLGYIEATAQTYQADDGLWYTAVQHSNGEWTYLPAFTEYHPDGRLFVMAGNHAQGNERRVYVNPADIGKPATVLQTTQDPGYDPMPVDGVSIPKAYFQAKRGNLSIGSLMPEGKWFSRRGLFYREPVHGHWYESKWFWFCVGLTAVFAMIWYGQMLHDPEMGYAMLHPFSASVDGDTVFIAWMGWIYWGWIFFLPGVTGALQKEGYKRLAVVYAVGITILIHLFFSRSKTTQ
jgi:hypothetical protein